MSFFDQVRKLLGGRSGSDTPQIKVPFVKNMPTSGDLPRDSDAQEILADIVEQAIAAGEGYRIKLSGSERYQQLKKGPVEEQIAVIDAAIYRPPDKSRVVAYADDAWKVKDARKTLLSQLLRRKIDVPTTLLDRLLKLWLKTGYALEYSEVPGLSVLAAIERVAETDGLPKELIPALKRIQAKVSNTAPHRTNLNKWELGVADRVSALLDPETAANRSPLPSGPFAQAFTRWVEEQPKAKREAWMELAVHAGKSADKSVPSKKWCKDAEGLVKAVGKKAMGGALLHWLAATKPDPAHPDLSQDILKGMIWMAPLAGNDELAGAIGRFAETCYRKVSGIGARSVKLGNAALYALSEMPKSQQAGAELFRLHSAIKYPSARKILDQRIGELAAASGSDIASLEDAALPDQGIASDGTLLVHFGDAKAVLNLSATSTDVDWTNAAGKHVKNPPAPVKADFKEQLASFKLAVKDIEKARVSQAKRLEESWLEGRSWAFPDWQEHYANHNLRRPLVEALIWQVEAADGAIMAAILRSGQLESVSGDALEASADAKITLWHPLNAEPDAVVAWRQRIVDLEITQPVKQAHREIYVLTDAERRTETYSNRFAAHILRQHQFRALCQARSWHFDFLGGWDSWSVPTRTLPALGLAVEYSVEAIEDGQHSDAYVPLHLATDQVRFIDTSDRSQLNLIDVDPVVFSELMRDVDLFVAVTSVANDPGWADGGPEGRFGTYWRDWAFGDLGQSAETRKELIASVVPRLSISDKLEIAEKSLIVTGKRHKYAIHFGSANIQILPQNRYLCIVPDRNPAEAERIRLPFSGDSQLSTILAKAFMLVDEGKIKDATILSQL